MRDIKQMQQEVDQLSMNELEKNLITLDYRGKEFKKLCLNRYIGLIRQQESNAVVA